MPDPTPTDAVLRRIDEALEALFPPDPELDPRIVELILRAEIAVDDDEEPDDDGRHDYPDDIDDPFGLFELHALYAAWSRARDHRGAYVVYGIDGPAVVFVAKPVAYAIDAAIPRIDDEGHDWESVVPWVAQDQDEVLPTSIVERFGTSVATALDGLCITFHADDADAIVAAAEAHGMYCERDDALVLRVQG